MATTADSLSQLSERDYIKAHSCVGALRLGKLCLCNHDFGCRIAGLLQWCGGRDPA